MHAVCLFISISSYSFHLIAAGIKSRELNSGIISVVRKHSAFAGTEIVIENFVEPLPGG